MTPPAASRPSPRPGAAPSPAGVALAGLAALAAGLGVGRFALTPVLPMMQAETGLTIADGAWLASANYVGYLLGAVSVMVVRIPASVGIRAGLVVIGAVTLAMGLEHRLMGWVLLRGAAGLASAWVLIGVSACCLTRLGALGRPALGGVVFAGVGTGIAVAGGLCLVLMQLQIGAAITWMVLGTTALGAAAATWGAFDDGHEAAGSPPGDGGAPGSRPHSGAARLVLCYGAFGFGYIIPATFLPALAREIVRDPLVFGWAWPVFGAAAAASTLGVARVSRILPGRRLWIVAQLLMGVGVVLPAAWTGTAAIVLAGILVGGTFMVITLVGMQEAHRQAGAHAARLMSAMTASFAAGQILGPLSVWLVVGPDGDFSGALLAAAGVLGASALALAPGIRRRTAADRLTAS